MFSVVSFYWPNVLAAVVVSLGLARLGTQLAARSEVLQGLVASQAASFGVLAFLACSLALGLEDHSSALGATPFAFAASLAAYYVGQRVAQKRAVLAPSMLMAMFLGLLGGGYLLTSIYSNLERHFAAAFMGDLATATKGQSFWLVALGLGFLALDAFVFRRILLQSFWLRSARLGISSRASSTFYLLGAVLLVESTRLLGFLFTCSCLVLIPLTASLGARSLPRFQGLLSLGAVVTIVLGFTLSLVFQQLSTSASIVFVQAVFVAIAWLRFS